jgi:hypothetical protein
MATFLLNAVLMGWLFWMLMHCPLKRKLHRATWKH